MDKSICWYVKSTKTVEHEDFYQLKVWDDSCCSHRPATREDLLKACEVAGIRVCGAECSGHETAGDHLASALDTSRAERDEWKRRANEAEERAGQERVARLMEQGRANGLAEALAAIRGER